MWFFIFTTYNRNRNHTAAHKRFICVWPVTACRSVLTARFRKKITKAVQTNATICLLYIHIEAISGSLNRASAVVRQFHVSVSCAALYWPEVRCYCFGVTKQIYCELWKCTVLGRRNWNGAVLTMKGCCLFLFIILFQQHCCQLWWKFLCFDGLCYRMAVLFVVFSVWIIIMWKNKTFLAVSIIFVLSNWLSFKTILLTLIHGYCDWSLQ